MSENETPTPENGLSRAPMQQVGPPEGHRPWMPEPWRACRGYITLGTEGTGGYDKFTIVMSEPLKWDVAYVPPDHCLPTGAGSSRATAVRIAQCVNACARGGAVEVLVKAANYLLATGRLDPVRQANLAAAAEIVRQIVG